MKMFDLSKYTWICLEGRRSFHCRRVLVEHVLGGGVALLKQGVMSEHAK